MATKKPSGSKVREPRIKWVDRPGVLVRLSDPEMKSAMRAAARRLSNKREALEFLKGIGVATPTGRLSKRFGG